MTSESHCRPLQGVRVVDCTHAMAGPYATSLLGDLGAEVIKVEAPSGDFIRRMDHNLEDGTSSYFYSINRNKRSICIDLKSPEAREVFERLISWGDVFVSNFRESALKRISATYDELHRINPQLIYCKISGFDAHGPKAGDPAVDLAGQAISGIMGVTGEHDGPPIKAGPSITDILTAYLSCYAVAAALYGAAHGQGGMRLDLNLADSALSSMPNLVAEQFATGQPVRPFGSGHPQAVPYQAFRASDGYFVIACLTDAQWRETCAAIGQPELAEDPRYTTPPARIANREQLIAHLAEIFAQHDCEHWLTRMAKTNVPCAPVNRLEAAIRDPLYAQTDILTTLADSAGVKYTTVASPVRIDAERPAPTRPGPRLGEHTIDVLTELGFAEPQISSLMKAGACALA